MGLGLAGVAVLVVVILAGVLTYLHTGAGGRRVARTVVDQARDAIQGKLSVGEVRLRGLSGVCVRDVDLRDPDGNPALRAQEVCADLDLPALARKLAHVSSASATGLWADIATVPGPDGVPTTTLARALAARKQGPPPVPGEPSPWVVQIDALTVDRAGFALRPAPKADASFSLEDLTLRDGHARSAAAGAGVGLKLTGNLAAPGALPLQLEAEARLDGTPKKGKLTVSELHLRAGESRLSAQGWYELGTHAGELHLRDVDVRAKDLRAALPDKQLLSGDVRGELDARSDGKVASAELRLHAGGGDISAKAESELKARPRWSVDFKADGVDPSGLSARAPEGKVSATLTAQGKGFPIVDAHGVEGDLKGKLHVGPAELDRMGPVRVDLDAALDGRWGFVRAFTASALGLKLSARGAAGFEELSLDVDAQAPDLRQVSRAIATLTKKPGPALAGSAKLSARVTGSRRRPDAQLHLRAPELRVGVGLHAVDLAVDGLLQGELTRPTGSLSAASKLLELGGFSLGAPRIAADVDWPVAHLRVDAGVTRGPGLRPGETGSVTVAGDATIDDDRDGLVLSNFLIAWPQNTLRLAQPTRLHLRENETELEPLELRGEPGTLRLSALLRPAQETKPGAVSGAVVLEGFRLDRLPAFALPRDLDLSGVIDATVAADGPLPAPDLDLQLRVRGLGARRVRDISGELHAHLRKKRLEAQGQLAGPLGAKLTLQAELPAASLSTLPPTAPLQLDAALSGVDLGRLAELIGVERAEKAKLAGRVEVRLIGRGTLGAPHLALSIDARDVSSSWQRDGAVRAGLVLDKNKAAVDGQVTLAGVPVLGLVASLPLDVARALREPGYLESALERPGEVEAVISRVQLAQLVRAGLLPEGSAGEVSAALRLSGTAGKPKLTFSANGKGVSVGRFRDVGFQADLGVDQSLRLAVGVQPGAAAVARLSGEAQVSAAELVELARRRGERAALDPLLSRKLTLDLDVPELLIGRVAQLAGREPAAEGVLTGHLSFTGSPQAPQLTGRVEMRQLATSSKALGNADVYLEADASGALLHLGASPPPALPAAPGKGLGSRVRDVVKESASFPVRSGGTLLAHARLDADLTARALIDGGVEGLKEGQLSGRVTARALDLAFLGGLVPRVRRAAGTLDGDVTLEGILGKPKLQGEAHLRGGLADVIGQGVFEDVAFDASFSPKEVVLDRLTGSTGGGHFSTIFVVSRRPGDENDDEGERLSFTGEVHLGDAESVRDRKGADGRPLSPAPVPIRQAGEERGDVTGEVDLFGEYENDTLTATLRIPDARVRVRALPDKRLPNLKPNPEVLLVHPGEKAHPVGIEPEQVAAEEEARKKARFKADLHLDLQHMYVAAADFEFPVKSDLHFTYDARNPDRPAADGTIEVPNGSFSALGRRFEIENAKITETGGDITDPELEIKARYENPSAVVLVNVSGSAREPQVDLSSTPPMDQDAIAFFLATGRVQGRATQQGGGVDLSNAATSVLGGLLFGQLRKELADVLPVDVITIEAGQGGTVSQASVGKYIGDRLFVGYRQRLTPAPGENQSEGRIEYEISRAVAAEATVGERNSDVSILFTKDF